MRWLLVALGVLAAGCVILLLSEFQTALAAVWGRGGVWLHCSFGLRNIVFLGLQARLQPGRKARVWLLLPFVTLSIDDLLHKVVNQGKYQAQEHKPRKRQRRSPLRRKGFRLFRLLLRANYNSLKKSVIKQLDVRLLLGLEGDAATTALLCGGVSAALFTVRSALTHADRMPAGRIRVQPFFAGSKLRGHIKCIVAVKARHIMWELFKAMSGR